MLCTFHLIKAIKNIECESGDSLQLQMLLSTLNLKGVAHLREAPSKVPDRFNHC